MAIFFRIKTESKNNVNKLLNMLQILPPESTTAQNSKFYSMVTSSDKGGDDDEQCGILHLLNLTPTNHIISSFSYRMPFYELYPSQLLDLTTC